MLSGRRARQRDEQGAVAVLTALCAVGLCVAAALVVDLGLMRVDRQVAKSAQDSAALAGVNGLVPNIHNATFHPFAGVCTALNYLKANSPDYATFSTSTWSDGAGGAIAGDGCDASKASQVCVPGNRATWARFTGTTADGRSQVYIQSGYTVSADPVDTVSGGAFPEESLPVYASDSGAVTSGGCDQVAVIISETRNTTLGAPAAASMGTRVRSVARVLVEPPKSPFALLILEQHNCQVLANGANGVAAIEVQGYQDSPGMIHSDSAGDGANCNKALMVGTKSDGIVAKKAPLTSDPGQISTVATSNQIDTTDNVYAEPKVAGSVPISSGVVTRDVVDRVFLSGVRARVADSAFAWNAGSGWGTAAPTTPVSTQLDPSGNPWTVMGCPAAAAVVTAAPRVLVKCPNLNSSVTFSDATHIIFTGEVGGGSSVVRMPKAINVYVHGNTGPNGTGAAAGTELSMHNAGQATCGSSPERARLFIRAGKLDITGGTFQACNTSIILLGGYSDGCLPAVNGTYYANGKVCDTLTKTGNGLLNMGGNAIVDWTAPSTVPDTTPANLVPQAARDELEDLMFWSETYGVHGLGGGGSVHLSGVFVAPNADALKLNGNPAWDVLNSQYVVRTLENNGGAVFKMQPMPSLPVAPPSISFYLAR